MTDLLSMLPFPCASGADLSSASQTAAPARKRGRRTSTKTTSTNPVTAQDSTPAAEAVGAEAHAPTVSPAKQLAQQLAQKEIAAHGMAAAAASSTTWVASDDLLSAGSQAQSDNLLMAATKGMQVRLQAQQQSPCQHKIMAAAQRAPGVTCSRKLCTTPPT